ncbi:MAG: DUF4270 family protein, partial [Leeuwenhoekiella sp.]
MKKFPAVFTLLTIILYMLAVACSSEDDATFPVGENWVSSGTKVYFIDTLTVESSTFQFDSISESSTDRYLIGSYTDPVFGLTKSKLYAQLGAAVYTIASDAKFDSIALILNYDNYFYNDTIPDQTFNVYRVTQDIKPDEDVYYNTTTFESDTEPLGSYTFSPRPVREDSIHLPLKNDFGQLIFDELQDNVINNTDEFVNEYKGLLIDAANTNTTMLGFSTDSFLRIYYTVDSEIEEEDSQTIDISFNTTNTFNNISSKKEGTYFANLANEQDFIPSTETSNTSFIQAGTGIATRVGIPYLERLNDIDGDGTILTANLKITLKQNSNTSNLYTRDSLQVYIIDQKNQVLGQLYDYSGANA